MIYYLVNALDIKPGSIDWAVTPPPAAFSLTSTIKSIATAPGVDELIVVATT